MVKSHPKKLVLIAVRVHLFPSRTQKLSSLAPTILGGRLPGKIGNANTNSTTKVVEFFLARNKPPACFSRQGQYVGPPKKVGKVNTKSQTKVWLFFIPSMAFCM